MEKFLHFWSHYNAAIIESLVALILISAIYLAYRSFFGAKGADNFDSAGAGAGAGVNTAHIEKTLQKILDQQQVAAKNAKSSPSLAEDSAGATSAGAAVPAEMIQELSQLKKSLEEKEKQIVVLQEKATQAAQAAQSAQASNAGPSADAIAAAANAAAGLAEKERQDYEGKIKELEARLAEYEIISEDIADLSFFKEENARLTKELEALKGGGGSAPATPAAAPAANEPPPTASEPPPAAASAVASAAEATPEPAVAPEPALETVPAPAAPEASPEAMNAIDDSLMAEFAKAVESQKSGTLEPAAKKEDNKLLEDFENFNKKS